MAADESGADKGADKLQVATMRPDDSGRGIARVPRAVMTRTVGALLAEVAAD